VRLTPGRHRRTRTLSVAAAVALSACGGGVYLGLQSGGAQAAGTTVTVSTTAQLESAVANAAAGTVIQVHGGTYYPARTLKSTADGTGSARITLTAYGSEKVRIDGSKLAAGSWLAGIYGDYWTVSGLTFQKSPAQGFVATSSVGGVFKNLVTADNGDSGFTLRGDGTTGNLVQNLDSYGNYDRATHGQNADGLAIKFGSGSGNRSPAPASTTTRMTDSTSGSSPRPSPSTTPGPSATARTAGTTRPSRATATDSSWAGAEPPSHMSSTTTRPGTTPCTASPRTPTPAPSC